MSYRFQKSAVLWLLVFLGLTDIGFRELKPLRYYSLGGYISKDQNPLEEKLFELKKCDRSTNALLLGSSLPMCAAACSDEGITKKVFHVDYDLFCYSKAENLSRAISHALNKNIKLFNFSGNGCMISDAKRIIDEALSLKPNFSLLVLAIAPRDFIDNTASPINKTEYSRFFFDNQSVKPKYVSISQGLDAWAQKNSYFYYTRSDYRFLLTAITTSFFKRGKDLYDATHFANDDNLFQISKLKKK